MPISYRIDPDASLLFVTADGRVTQAERLEAMAAWIGDPLFRPGMNAFCDFSAADSTPTLEELRGVVSYIDRQGKAIGRLKLAVLAPKVVTFGVARQFQAMTAGGPLEVRVFSDRDAAWSWLRPNAEVSPPPSSLE